MNRPQGITLNCPHCSFSYQAPIINIIDVGQIPELKQAFLAGQLNASQCPNCNNINYVATPILYHDPEHEFLGVFIPEQMQLSEDKRQKLIGELTKALMDSLPPKQRRGYMLTPQQFLTMDSLAEKIYGFDGITPEMLAANRRKTELVMELGRLLDDDIAFQAAVQNNKEYLDDEFFMLLAHLSRSASESGDSEFENLLTTLREKLIPLTETGQRIEKQREAVRKLGESPRRSDVMKAILEGDLDEVEAITVAVSSALDYSFFAELTEHIEKASGEERELLEQKRQRMLQILENIRASEAEVMQEYSQALQAMLSAEDMERAVLENLQYVDLNLMNLLSMNIAQAEEQGATAAAERLRSLADTIVKVANASMPPEMTLLSALLAADYPEGTRKILRENRELVTEDFLNLLETSINNLEEKREETPEAKATLKHLRNVLTQARLGV